MDLTSSNERVVNEDPRRVQPHQRLSPACTYRIANVLREKHRTGMGIEELADNADLHDGRMRTFLLRAEALMRPQGRSTLELVGTSWLRP